MTVTPISIESKPFGESRRAYSVLMQHLHRHSVYLMSGPKVLILAGEVTGFEMNVSSTIRKPWRRHDFDAIRRRYIMRVGPPENIASDVMPTPKMVILDKNFLQAENGSTPRLCALAKCGCEFALIDTLIYELCSDTRLPNLWGSIQKKLFPFADRLHVWFHSSELLRREVASNAAISGPENSDATKGLRAWFRSGKVYVPDNLQDTVAGARQQREIDSMEKVAPMARAFGSMIRDAKKGVGSSKDELAGAIKDNLDDECLVRFAIRACYGNCDSLENHIPDAANRIDSRWFAFHHARATLALIAIFLQKYGLTEEPGKKFPNTKLDLDYLALLHYANAIASDETTGDMAEMCKWLYGSTKEHISSKQLLASKPT